MRCLSISLSLFVSTLIVFNVSAAPPRIDPDLPDGTDAAIKQIATFRVPEGLEGLKVELFAAEPQLASPVAIGVDEHNRVFVAEEYRFNRGTEENRTRPFLLEDDLQLQTTEDRLAMFQKFADKFDGGMNWFTKTSDQLRLVEDTDGDGRADRSTVFATGFNEPLDGLAAGVLAHNGDVYFTCIPHLWRLRDTDGDGVADVKEKLLSGFGVNAGFLGHDLHGLAWGPDGKLYFSIGDRGFHVTSKEGLTFHGPRNGAVFRCYPDGTEFEVVHRGLRNPQEIAFDQFGNLFAADNNCDKGDHSRLVHIVEGGDSGWNMAFQSLNPPYLTGPWHAESMWRMPDAPEAIDLQPSWIVPPVGPLGAGPSGFAYYPGVGLPDRYAGHFFMCNYTGGGGIESFAVKPRGASFEITDAHDFLKPINATDVEFGYDGKMYVSDFVNLDWSGKSLGGRIFTVHDPRLIARDEVTQTKQILRDGFQVGSINDLVSLLSHADMRVRLRAQFELATRGEATVKPLLDLATYRDALTVSRLHSIWTLSQIGRRHPDLFGSSRTRESSEGGNATSDRSLATSATAKALLALLADEDEHVRCQAIKSLGEARVAEAVPQLLPRLREGSSRTKFFAAMALGKIAAGEPHVPIGARCGDVAFPTKSPLVPTVRSPEEQARVKRGTVNLGLIEMLRDNADADPYLRHAGVMALAWIGDLELLQSFSRDRSPAVRRAVLLVQRRMADPRCEQFLDDEDWTIVTEAARAINDVPIEVSQPALARKLEQLTTTTVLKSMSTELSPGQAPVERVINLESLLRRSINANFRLGGAESVQRVAAIVMNAKHSTRVREEAFAALTAWTEPTARDRVTGFWRPLPKRDPAVARDVLNEKLPELLASAQGNLVTQVVELVARHGLQADEATFAEWLTDAKRPAAARVAALKLLAARNVPMLAESLQTSLKSDVPLLRAAAREIIALRDATAGLSELRQVLDMQAPQASTGSQIDRQRAFATLAAMKHKDADADLATWAERLASGGVALELQVDLLEAATARREIGPINLALQRRSAALSAKTDDPLAAHRLALQGGDVETGRAVFTGHAQGQCIRCHKIRGEGGTAGPDLTEVVKRNRETPEGSREHLLQSLIDPNAKITPGFGSITLVLDSGRVIAGTLKVETAQHVSIETPDGRVVGVPINEIEERTPPKSAMPPMGKVLSPRELRDVIEFLATLSP